MTDVCRKNFTYLLTYLFTYYMEQSPSRGANRFSTSLEITHILWNPRVHYGIHKCLRHLDSVHNSTSHFLMIHLNIIILSTSAHLVRKKSEESKDSFYEELELLSKSLKIKIYRTIILPVVLYGCETWSLTVSKEGKVRVSEYGVGCMR